MEDTRERLQEIQEKLNTSIKVHDRLSYQDEKDLELSSIANELHVPANLTRASPT